jgi:hypothetical protein
MNRHVVLLPVLVTFLVGAAPATAWTWPVDGPVLKQFQLGGDPYAAGQHRGVDIAATAGSTVRAPAAGTVTFAGTVPHGGRTVTIETPDGYAVTLLHLGSLGIARGASVGEGDAVGSVGSSGDAEHAEPYVHLGVRLVTDPNGYLDPLAFLPPPEQAPAAPAIEGADAQADGSQPGAPGEPDSAGAGPPSPAGSENEGVDAPSDPVVSSSAVAPAAPPPAGPPPPVADSESSPPEAPASAEATAAAAQEAAGQRPGTHAEQSPGTPPSGTGRQRDAHEAAEAPPPAGNRAQPTTAADAGAAEGGRRSRALARTRRPGNGDPSSFRAALADGGALAGLPALGGGSQALPQSLAGASPELRNEPVRALATAIWIAALAVALGALTLRRHRRRAGRPEPRSSPPGACAPLRATAAQVSTRLRSVDDLARAA